MISKITHILNFAKKQRDLEFSHNALTSKSNWPPRFAPSDVYLRSQVCLEPGNKYQQPQVVENTNVDNKIEEFFDNSYADFS
jgi:hypothetical protein